MKNWENEEKISQYSFSHCSWHSTPHSWRFGKDSKWNESFRRILCDENRTPNDNFPQAYMGKDERIIPLYAMVWMYAVEYINWVYTENERNYVYIYILALTHYHSLENITQNSIMALDQIRDIYSLLESKVL